MGWVKDKGLKSVQSFEGGGRVDRDKARKWAEIVKKYSGPKDYAKRYSAMKRLFYKFPVIEEEEEEEEYTPQR